MNAADARRRDQVPAYVLHSYPFKETSLIVELLTRDQGRLPVIAKGARRPHSQVRGVLMPFQPLHASWSGKGEVRTLVRAEWSAGPGPLQGLGLMCGFYLNELLLKLLPREDPHPELFDAYESAIGELAARSAEEVALRRFELALLAALGYAPLLDREAEGRGAVQPQRLYTYALERGPVAPVEGGEAGLPFRGKTLLDLAAGDFSDPVTLQEAKALMRQLIGHYLGGAPLHTRQLLKDLTSL